MLRPFGTYKLQSLIPSKVAAIALASAASLNYGIPVKPISTSSASILLAKATPFHWFNPCIVIWYPASSKGL